MRRCPVCEKELTQGLVCGSCGFDQSCSYEQNRTLCSALPGHAEPVSVCAAKWKQQQKQTITAVQGTLVCPKCGGRHFLILIGELRFMCADCETKMPFALLKEAVKPRPVPHKKAQSESTGSLIGLGRTKAEREKINRAFDVLMDKTAETRPAQPKKSQSETQPVPHKKPQSESTGSLIGLGRTKEEREKADRAFDILMDKS